MKTNIRINEVISDTIMRISTDTLRTIIFKDLVNKEDYTFEFFNDSRTLLITRKELNK
jgi:hypothetical protein